MLVNCPCIAQSSGVIVGGVAFVDVSSGIVIEVSAAQTGALIAMSVAKRVVGRRRWWKVSALSDFMKSAVGSTDSLMQ